VYLSFFGILEHIHFWTGGFEVKEELGSGGIWNLENGNLGIWVFGIRLMLGFWTVGIFGCWN